MVCGRNDRSDTTWRGVSRARRGFNLFCHGIRAIFANVDCVDVGRGLCAFAGCHIVGNCIRRAILRQGDQRVSRSIVWLNPIASRIRFEHFDHFGNAIAGMDTFRSVKVNDDVFAKLTFLGHETSLGRYGLD